MPVCKAAYGYNSNMTPRETPLVIGIAGGSGSGKTTVASVILQRVGADRIAYLPHDAYYRDLSALPPNQRMQVNFDHPDSLETSLLVEFSRDLTQLAREDKLDPVIGRDVEIQRVIQILSRRTKNNPVLIGEPGVGKTAIAEGLAHRIVNGETMPMFTSCCPAWVKYAEEFAPEFLPNLSSCKSPQQMFGALAKTYYAKNRNLDPSKV